MTYRRVFDTQFPKKRVLPEDFIKFCHSTMGVTPGAIEAELQHWLNEDCGSGDAALMSLGNVATTVEMGVFAKGDFVLAGLPLMCALFFLSGGKELELFSDLRDGEFVKKGQLILAGRGAPASFLLGERVSLNLASRLSGIATLTQKKIQELESAAKNAGSNTYPQLLETRKTTPGLRRYEKYATRVGGARNHRHGLDAGAMLKENHLRSSLSSLADTVAELKKRVPMLCKVECEVTNLSEFDEALKGGADVIMLDNFSAQDVEKAVSLRSQQTHSVELEISGNLDAVDASILVKNKVDYISMGALIHQAQSVDMSLQLFRKN